MHIFQWLQELYVAFCVFNLNICAIKYGCFRFMGAFPDKETEGAFNDVDDGVFGVRKLNKIDEKYEICLRYMYVTFGN